MSLFASTMAMFDNVVVKHCHGRYIACSVAMPSRGCVPVQVLTAVPNPYQPGSIRRHCDQLKTQGFPHNSSMRAEPVREAGRLPILRLAISPITVESRK